MTDPSLIEEFAQETREHLEALESALLQMALNPSEPEPLNDSFRSIHTIKGASEYLGFDRIARLSHRLENILDLYRSGTRFYDKIAVDLFIDARDRMEALLTEIESSGEEGSEIDDLLSRVDALSEEPTPSGEETAEDGSLDADKETDAELLTIFMEQLIAGIEELMATARRIMEGSDLETAVGKLADQVDRMSATANYMGFDAINRIYDDLTAALSPLCDPAGNPVADAAASFVESHLVPSVRRIQALFPEFQTLADMDVSSMASPTETITETDLDEGLLLDEEVLDDSLGQEEEDEPELELSLDLDEEPQPEPSSPEASMPPAADPSLVADFAQETREHLDALESSLLQMALNPSDPDLLNDSFRSIHTIKGASEYLGFDRIADLSHRLENLLDLYRSGTRSCDKIAVDLFIDARDRMEALVTEIESSGEEGSEIDDLLSRVTALSEESTPSGEETAEDGSLDADKETDAELLTIFMEQLIAGIEELMATARRIMEGSDLETAVGKLADQVDRMSATANYMGFDAINRIYDDLTAALSPLCDPAGNPVADAAASFVESHLVPSVRRIQALFPEFQTLADMDVSSMASPTETITETDLDEGLLLDEEVLDDSLGQEEEDEPELELSLDLDEEPQPEPSSPEASMPPAADPSLVADFAQETREHLDALESSLLQMALNPSDPDLLNDSFRSIHTIKGASEYLGFDRIADLSHRLENLLDLYRSGTRSCDKIAVDLFIDARDRMEALVTEIESSGEEGSEIDDLLSRVTALSEESTPSGEETAEDGSLDADKETDAELLTIFMEQLIAGIEALMATARRIMEGSDLETAVGKLADQVDRMSATANYMGFDAINRIYDDLTAALSPLCDPAGNPDADAAASFVESHLVPSVRRIQALFPEFQTLADMDVSSMASPTETIAEKDLDEDQLLDEEELDHSLHQEEDEHELELSPDPDEEPQQEPLSSESSTAPAADASLLSDFAQETREQLEETSDDFVELWPMAKPIPAVGRDDSAEEESVVAPSFDFSIPSTEEKVTGERSTLPPESTEAFKARKMIRKSIRVDAEKIDSLMNQVGELVVNRSSFSQIFHQMRDLIQYLNQRFDMDKADLRMVNSLAARINDATSVLGRVSGELQEQVMKVRMLPIAQLFNRYPRLIHDLVKDTDKKVQLQFQGEETELDRMVIEQLADPMIHIIRNAVDHGIETREERKRKGKPETGVLVLAAYQEGSNVVIDITDDGKGIDLSRVRQKAVERNLVDPATLADINQRELVDLIMLPGFSTASKITHTSGRGVGMDVVKRNIEKINGTMMIDTRQDVGTRIRITIPLTLAIIPALMVHCEGAHFTIPLSTVAETLHVDKGEIFFVDGSEVIHLHDEPLPLIRLTDILHMKTFSPVSDTGRLCVVVVNAATGRAGFIVNTLLGRQEVVVKPLDDYLQEKSGISGATILGDGGISLILNVDELVTMAKEWLTEKKISATVF